MSRKLRIGEAAAAVGLTTHTLRLYVKNKQINAQRTPGGHLRFLESDLDTFMKDNQRKWDK